MILLSKREKNTIIFFLSAPILCGIFRLLFYQTDFIYDFSSLFCGLLTLLWAITIQKRITDKRLCSLILLINAFLLLNFTLQILRNDLFLGSLTVQRYLLYAMYVPMTAQPLLCFFLAVCIHRPKDKPLPPLYYAYIVVGILLTLGVLTNDLHFWAKSFPEGFIEGSGRVKNGWLHYLINIFIYGLYTISFVILQKKNHCYIKRKVRWLTAIPFLIGFIYFLLYPLGIGYRIFRMRFLDIGEMLFFCIVATLEACIQVGMIPANKNYEKLFSSALIPAVILDDKGNPVYRTAAAEYPFPQCDDTEIMSHPINGGSIKWTVDIAKLRVINRQLEETSQQIEARNAYIAEENRIKQERTELETRNQLYDNISRIVQPQLPKIDALLKDPEGCGEKQLAEIAVLKAYVKRRSNMEMLSAAGLLTNAELVSAVTESLEYMRLCGVNTAVSSMGMEDYPSGMVIAAYEQIESILEESLDSLSYLVVTIRGEKGQFTVRMMLKAENFSWAINTSLRNSEDFSCRGVITKNDQDMIIVLTFLEGGKGK